MTENACAQSALSVDDAADEIDGIDIPRTPPANDTAEQIIDSAAPADARSEQGPSTAPSDATLNRRSRAQIRTARLDSRDFRPSWPIAIASLEQLSGWAVLALRLGILALIQQCVRELAEEHTRPEVIVRLRALTEALAHMPLEA